MVTTYYDISVQEANTTSLFVSKHSNESDYIIYVHLDTTDSHIPIIPYSVGENKLQ